MMLRVCLSIICISLLAIDVFVWLWERKIFINGNPKERDISKEEKKYNMGRLWGIMTKLEAFSFLKDNQPMPSDDELTKQDIEKYEEVRKFLLYNADVQFVPLLLNSFGGKDGYGVYQMIEDVIMMYSKDEVLPHILNAFHNPSKYVVYWNV